MVKYCTLRSWITHDEALFCPHDGLPSPSYTGLTNKSLVLKHSLKKCSYCAPNYCRLLQRYWFHDKEG